MTSRFECGYCGAEGDGDHTCIKRVTKDDVVVEETPVVRQSDARILREALSWVHKHTPAFIQQKVNEALFEYAKNLTKYCKHTDYSYINVEEKNACLDCGTRWEPPKELDVK